MNEQSNTVAHSSAAEKATVGGRTKKNVIWTIAILLVLLASAALFAPTRSGLAGAWDNGSWSVAGAMRLCLYSDGTFHSQTGGTEHEGVWAVGWFCLRIEICRQRGLLSERWTDLYAYRSIPTLKLGPSRIKLGDGTTLRRTELGASDEEPKREPHWPQQPRTPLALFDAIERNDAAAVRELLLRDPTLARTRNHDGLATVVNSAYSGQVEITRLLLGNGGDPNATNKHGMPALIISIMTHDQPKALELARLLVARGALISGRDSHGNTALHAAIQRRYIEMAEWLLKNSADPNSSTGQCEPPLCLAISAGDYDLTSLLIQHGARRDITNRAGMSVREMIMQSPIAAIRELGR